jgi:hypothetical protein
LTTPSLVIVGGAQRTAATLPSGATITTPALVLIGRRD